MSYASLIALLKTSLLLITLAQGPNVPQSLHDRAVSVAKQAIAAATQALSKQVSPTVIASGSGGSTAPDTVAPIVSGSVSTSVCTPLQGQTQIISCPSGQIGSITQTRSSSCATGATSPTWGAWQVSANSCAVSSGNCDISDLASLKSCFQTIAKYTTLNFKNDISCSDGSCCTNQYGFMQVYGVSGKTIQGNGHTFSRSSNQKMCPALLIANSSNITVSNLRFDEDESMSGCLVAENCPATIDATKADNLIIDNVSIYNGKADVVHVWGSNGFTFSNSVVSNAGIIGLYIGNSLWATSSNVHITGNVFAKISTNAIAIEGVEGSNTVDHNIITRSHYHGLFPTPNTAPSFGAPSSGGELDFRQVSNLSLTDNIISDGYCDNCWEAGQIEGLEIGDSTGQMVTHGFTVARNSFIDIFGTAFYLNDGSDLGEAVSGSNNQLRRVSNLSNYRMTSHLSNNPVTDAAAYHPVTNNIYRLAGQNIHRESPGAIDSIGTLNEGIFGLSGSPRNGASGKPLVRCLTNVTQDDFVSSDTTCGGQILDGVFGFSFEQSYSGAMPIYSCLVGAADHFISWDSGCEGQTYIEKLGYAVNRK